MMKAAVLGAFAVAVTSLPLSAQTLRGTLLDAHTGTPIDLGLVIMLTASGDSVTYSVTGSDGYFSITSPEPGSFTLVGSGLGYEETKVGIFDLGMGGELTIEFRLPARPMPIDEIIVELDREVLEHKLVRTGFVRRYQRNAGGRFITPHDIERSPDRSTEDLLRRVSGVHARPVRNERYSSAGYAGDAILMESRAGLCRPTVYVDGTRIRPGQRSDADELRPAPRRRGGRGLPEPSRGAGGVQHDEIRRPLRSAGHMDQVIGNRRHGIRWAAGLGVEPVALALLVTLALTTLPAAAQTIRVTILNAETSQPITGAVVQLHDEAGELLARQLSDGRGRTLFFRTGAGMQRLRVSMIGMATAETERFRVDHGATIRRELRLEPHPIPIAGLSVEGHGRCRTDPAEGRVTARLWEEARTALTATAIADEQAMYRYHILLFEQDLDRERRVVERSRQAERLAAVETPFVSRPVGHLVEYGFVERSGGTDLYLAPDAHVLLSEPFLDTHCFGARIGRSGADTEGLVGLTFEPTADRRHVVEVGGTLWLDPNTSELQWLEFRYLNLDPDIRLDELGGRVDFRRMPDGGWIIPEWYIRMPNVALQGDLEGDRLRTYVRGFRETGGRVLRTQEPGRVIGHSLAGAMEGVVEDSTGNPMADVRVELAGTDWVTETDSTGTFSFYPLVEGVYEVRLAHPTLDGLGRPPVELTRLVVDGETTLLEVRMPSVASVVLEVCDAASAPSPDSLPLLLSVRDADGRAAGDAAVQVTWPEGRTGFAGFAVDPDDAGTSTLCRVPRGRGIDVTATLPGELHRTSVEAGPMDDILAVELRLRLVDARGRPTDGGGFATAGAPSRAASLDAPPVTDAASDDRRFLDLGPAERAWLDSLGFHLRRDQALLHRTASEIGEAYGSLPALLAEVPRLEIGRRADGASDLLLHARTEWSPGSDDACLVDVYLNGSLVRQRRISGAAAVGADEWLDLDRITAIEAFDAAVAPVGPEDGCGALLLWASGLRDGEEPAFTGSIRGRLRGVDTALDAVRLRGDRPRDTARPRDQPGLRGVRIRLAPLDRTAEPGSDGRFQFDQVPPGSYTIQVDLPGVGAWSMPARIRAGSVAELSLDVNR